LELSQFLKKKYFFLIMNIEFIELMQFVFEEILLYNRCPSQRTVIAIL